MKTEQVLPLLPDIFGRHDEYPAHLIDAKIVAFGTLPDRSIEGGGLVIDYRPSGAKAVKRVIFAFCETGMWVELKEGSAL
jgi:hypothetical protein